MQFRNAEWDDLLFVRLANALRDGHWLGSFDKLTLAKGPGFSMFLAATSALHLPLRLAEQSVYLIGCWLIAIVAGRVTERRWLATIMFGAAALNPVFWSAALSPVVREHLYLGQTCVVLGLAALLTLVKLSKWRSFATGAMLGAVFAWFWLTREEGLWLVPPLALLALFGLGRAWLDRSRRAMAVSLAVPLIVFAALDLADAAMDYYVYGAFETNEFRAAPFKDAYGALTRVQAGDPRPYIPVPRAARAQIYAASPVARELAASLEGADGQSWQRIGCAVHAIPSCDDMQSGWFMWALRDAVASIGEYSSAGAAMRFYRRLAAEVNAACASGTLRCGPPRSGFLPPLTAEYAPGIMRSAAQLAVNTAELGGEFAADPPSDDVPGIFPVYRRVALGPWTRPVTLDPNRGGILNGWLYARQAKLSPTPELGPNVKATPAPDVAQAVGAGSGEAMRFSGPIPCTDGACELPVLIGGKQVSVGASAITMGPVAGPDGTLMFIDDVQPLEPPPRGAAWNAEMAVYNVMRPLGTAFVPLGALLALVLLATDLRTRQFKPITVLWLALLGTVVCRILLLAVLDATSMPATMVMIYVSPAIGPAILLACGATADTLTRLAAAARQRHRSAIAGLAARHRLSGRPN